MDHQSVYWVRFDWRDGPGCSGIEKADLENVKEENAWVSHTIQNSPACH
jgi:hypothetical protein